MLKERQRAGTTYRDYAVPALCLLFFTEKSDMILGTMYPVLLAIMMATAVVGVGNWYVRTADICPVPIYYRLGEVDERFVVKEEEVKKVLLQAEAVWEDLTDRDLFVYDERSDFAINLIYDERQQMAHTEEEWRLSLDAKESESLSLLEQVKVEAAEYEKMQANYSTKREAYEERLRIYNEEVKDLNDKGGAPAPTYNKLQKEQEELNAQMDVLIELERELNQKGEEINEKAQKGNELIENYNAEVIKYNEVYSNRDLYTQGDFQRDRINIYKFSDLNELSKVIVHEFGHSLGLGHVEGEKSIMYYLMADQPDSITPTAEDREALLAVCGEAEGFLSKMRRIIRTTLSYFK